MSDSCHTGVLFIIPETGDYRALTPPSGFVCGFYSAVHLPENESSVERLGVE